MGAADTKGDTLCTKSRRGKESFTYRHYQFTRVKVAGVMNSANILKACSAAKLRPVCDHSHYSDGKCRMVGSNWHFSHPAHDRRHKVPVAKVKGAYFYTGYSRSRHMSLLNTGRTHRWANNWDRDGDTFCVKRGKSFATKFKYGGYTVLRVPVTGGRMNSATIWKTCRAKGMRPVCDHESYMDGKCILVGTPI